MGNFFSENYPSFFLTISYYNDVIQTQKGRITYMLIDQRKVTLKATKHYNNSYNYLITVYPGLKRGKAEFNRKKLQKKTFPNEEDFALNHNEESIKKLLKKDNNALTSDEYNSFAPLFDCEPTILFKDVDEINEFEQAILKECFSKLEHCIHDLCRSNVSIDVPTLKRALMRDHNHFYYEPVLAAIEFTRLFCTDLMMLENDFSEKCFDLVCFKQYLDTAFNFLKENIYPIFKTFGDYSFSYVRKCDGTEINDYVNQTLIGLDDWLKKTILEKLSSKNGKSAFLVLQDGVPVYDTNIKKSKEDIRKAKANENSGMYLTKYLGRYRRYQGLSLYSKKLNKGAEIVAVNNWIDLFSFLKRQVLLHSANFKDKNRENDLLDENCDNLLSHIFTYKIECCNFITNYNRQNEILDMVNNVGSDVLPAILQEYINMVNNSVNYELFIGELL